jgi:hypothetical protein
MPWARSRRRGAFDSGGEDVDTIRMRESTFGRCDRGCIDQIAAMPATNAREAKTALIGGTAAGVIAGVAMAIVLLVMTLLQGQDVWPVFKGAAAPFIGDAAMRPGFELGPVLLGTLAHLAVSIGWGILFGLLVYGMSKGATVIVGALFGIVVWLGMYYVVLPLVGLAEMARTTAVSFAVITHVIFGFALGLGFLPFQVPKPAALTRRRVETVPVGS